jgi:signal transduction histidine kinase
VEGSAIGVLDVVNKTGGFSQDDIRIMRLFADQAAIAIEYARLRQQAEQVAVMEERQRLARELHDSVTQTLYTVTLFAEAAGKAISAGKGEVAAAHLQELRTMAREAMLDMRLLIFELHPPALEEEGLVGALRARLAAVEVRAGLQTEIRVEGEGGLSHPVEEALYRFAQEALNNVVKHAKAQHVAVRVRFLERSIRLEVRDDGVGFDPTAAWKTGGMGLPGMAGRIEGVHGRMEIDSAPGKGTTLSAEVAI